VLLFSVQGMECRAGGCMGTAHCVWHRALRAHCQQFILLEVIKMLILLRKLLLHFKAQHILGALHSRVWVADSCSSNCSAARTAAWAHGMHGFPHLQLHNASVHPFLPWHTQNAGRSPRASVLQSMAAPSMLLATPPALR